MKICNNITCVNIFHDIMRTVNIMVEGFFILVVALPQIAVSASSRILPLSNTLTIHRASLPSLS